MENIPQNETLLCDLASDASPLLIAIVGAGGKTSTMFWLAELFRQAGRRVLISTTTKMYLPERYPVLLCRDPLRLPAAVWQRSPLACFSAWQPQTGKVVGFAPALFDDLLAKADVDVVLVEADGAHGLALKSPGQHEPCMPQSSRCVIAVTGAQMLGLEIGPATVHRWPCFARITGAQPGSRLSWNMLYRLIRHPQGAFKQAPAGSRRIWLLNQFSQNEKMPDGALLADGEVDVIWAGAVQEPAAIRRRRVR